MPQAITELMERIGGQRRAMIIGAGVLVAALIFGVSQWATAPEWVPAFTNQPMETVGQMTDKLQQAGIPYKLDRGGSDILVSEADLARARVTLAKDGLPAAGRPGLELFDQPSWGMTDFTQRINYRRALEGELERTIGKMNGIQAVQVHLALHEESNFREQDKPANASVVLKTSEEPAPDVVQGIAHLVASSVDGLTSDRVTVLDDSGRLLSQPNDDGSVTALTSSQLAMQKEVEKYLQSKAEGLVSDIVGPSNARVRVTAALNFDKIDRQSELVDPDRQATSTEQKYEITPGPQGGAASTNEATSYENSKVTENFSGAIGNIKRLSVAVLINDKMTPGANGAKPTYVARTPQELARIDSLVRSAVGADTGRGDIITVVGSRFDGTSLISNVDTPKPTVWERAEQFQKPGIAVMGFVTFLVALLLILKALKPDAQHRAQLALATAPAAIAGMLPSGESNEMTAARTATPAIASSGETNGGQVSFLDRNNVRGKVITAIAHKPDVSARVVRAWLKEA